MNSYLIRSFFILQVVGDQIKFLLGNIKGFSQSRLDSIL